MHKHVNIAFVGAGKVGCSLARYLADGEEVGLAGFFSRSAERAREAAAFAGGAAFGSPDAAIESVAGKLAQLDLRGRVVAHCSGATGSSALEACREAGASVASCHPLYSVSSRFESWQ